MNTITNISGMMTTAQAAKALDVGVHNVGRLVREGEFSCIRTAGDAMLIPAIEVQKYAQLRQGRGRPLAPTIAMAALWELSGVHADWLNYAQTRRLKIRLKSVSVQDLVWQVRKRSQTLTFRCDASFLNATASMMKLSGQSCLDEFGLVGSNNVLEGYICVNDLNTIVNACFLAPDQEGNVVLHVSEWMPENVGAAMPVAVSAADLAASLDTRERSAGLEALEGMLDEYSRV
jgi:excisionase family DNA binding protein